MSNNCLITNARIVNEGQVTEGDVRICSGRIDTIASGLSAVAGESVIDAEGAWLMPGMIDDQVHFREPGLTAKGDMATESAAAVAGGITSFMEMPNVKPPTTNLDALEDKYTRAAGRASANYAFYLGATNDNIEQIRSIRPGQACGVKVFMGASTGAMLVDDEQTLEQIFADSPLLIATHCEDTPMITINEEAARQQYGEDVPMSEHPNIRSEEACYKSSSLAVELARRHDSRLHVLHLTTARELELFTAGPVTDKRITSEACVHHLFFDASDYERLGAQIKCNPAIKTAADREALLKAVASDLIDVIATDHAPHTAEEKASSYFKAPAGLPLVQHALLMTLEFVHDGGLDIATAVRKTSHAVADVFGVQERGYIREGYFADLVLVDPDRPTQVRTKDLIYKCGWSPLVGYKFRSSIKATLVNGEAVWRDGELTGAITGQRLKFG
ncbi:MAG: dihydroorotase [Gammaproteobacteria bacterium]|nr:dihydroorotase [Gammaproteobacteria bacterium]MCP4278047.1 dihydroorotase [Gammaproteobacteria bacterium]MCP4833023.1 dihydroorotase [Gammaproteobacteria bacterium]MCP4929264.1 dihydroorotase [Gammaproteobacteria bacterium]